MIELHQGDSARVLATLPATSVDLTVTSPPYDNLRTYKGFTFDFETIARELYRVTKPGGVVVWVVGDETKAFKESMTSFRQAIHFADCGFGLLDTMIYHKQNYAPAYPTLRRYANQFEYMFVFSKGRPATFNPVQAPKVRNKEEKVAYRMADGTLKRKVKAKGRETKDASNVWSFAVGGNITGHPAVYPEALARDHILSWSNPGDTVLDPFLGSGTTGKMAVAAGRKFVGIEISDEYLSIARRRIEAANDNNLPVVAPQQPAAANDNHQRSLFDAA